MYRRTKDCTAMILYNDEVAGSYMDFLKDRGLRVPEDISLVSFDDAGPVQEGDLTILSVIHPKYNLGRLTARNLLRMIEDSDWQEKKYSYRFPVMFNNGNSVRDITLKMTRRQIKMKKLYFIVGSQDLYGEECL